MSAGYPTTRGDIDARAGYLVTTLRDTFDQLARMKDFLDSQTDADLTARNYTADEIAALRAGIGDLASLGKIAHAQGTQQATNDFFFNAKKLAGLV